ncbi:hypothetical protein OEV98_14930 [Caldibacillus lycopersici]|uniref:Uncharacterized protein n=1 Tax=Perspicuibacillus lycopersici TaxID=1325689 RepID=A0AAE3IUN5_9BACI|nr:hypothetical protein [Perspicuibacillus lycopersici]MCU9614836.1 hypothetical protein [Perspicuibacillus lycopersici]
MENRLSVRTYCISMLSIIANVYLWLRVIFIEWSETELEVIVNFSILLTPPVVLAIIALYLKRAWIMYVAFITSLPIGLYLLANEGTWQLFGSLEILLLISAILMTKDIVNKNKTKTYA